MTFTVGFVAGVLVYHLWQGTQDANGGVGTGIRNIIDQSRNNKNSQAPTSTDSSRSSAKQETNYDFYTILPEREMLISDEELKRPEIKIDKTVKTIAVSNVKSVPVEDKTTKPEVVELSALTVPNVESAQQKTAVTATPAETVSKAFMLQAASYKQKSEANSLRAKLALLGLTSKIEKVTIQDRGEFYRVRLGPYKTSADMLEVDKTLNENGIRALKLSVLKRG